MRALLIVLALTAGCRTQLLEVGDGAVRDLAAFDLASRDVAAPIDLSHPPCPMSCDATQLCVFIDRGDCSSFTCAPRPPTCGATVSCDCLPPGYCDQFAMPDETLTCKPPFPQLGGDVICDSPIKCV